MFTKQSDDLVIAVSADKNYLSPGKCKVLLRQKGDKYRHVALIKKIVLAADTTGLEVIVWLPKFGTSKKMASLRGAVSDYAKMLSKFKNVSVKYLPTEKA
jgi:hypothetical protein